MTPGPIALVGSGEYLPVMQGIEAALLEGRNPRYVQLPTAAAPEGDRSLDHWVSLGQAQAQRLGVTAVPVLVRTREDAHRQDLVDLIAGAGLIYLSGGNPSFLANTLRDTPVWNAIAAAWQQGAALAGCSAGAMAIADHIPALRLPHHQSTRGLGVLPHLRVLPHFDKMFSWIPDLAMRIMKVPEGVTIIGIDEETALVGGPHEWVVQGLQSVWILESSGRIEYKPGDAVITY
ncbi:MAG: Type 1 glutamine amidotransferase-like domain-containing protein [Actinomycetes bacterium]